MKREMSSFDIMAALAEMQNLVGGRIDQVYQVGGDEIVLRIRAADKDKREVYVKAGKWVCPRGGLEKPQSPPPFAMALRKHIANAVVEAIEQRGFERVVVFRLQKRETYELVLELFGKGNIILVRDGVIVQPMFRQSWRDREVRAGQRYVFPPERANPLTMTAEDFSRMLSESELDLVRTLALTANLGGTYAEEVCTRAGLSKSVEASGLPEEAGRSIHEAILTISEAVRGGQEATIVRDQGEVVDAAPLHLRIHEGSETEVVGSFTAGLAAFLDGLTPAPPREVSVADPRTRMMRRLQNLEAGHEELLRREEEFRTAAEWIYGHFTQVEEALTAAREGSRTDIVRDVNFDRHWMVIDVDGHAARLDTRMGANQNADALYQKAKDARARAEEMEVEVEAAREGIESLEAARDEMPAPTRMGKTFWFERYRWFLSTEGNLVLGGRDAKSNESLVKKHLKPGDRYAHAEVQGAPSIVVKEGSNAGEATFDEACQMAVVYSKLWRAGAGTGTAYWVNPEQVSKTPESGEYLAKGAFVIRGKRNYRRDLALQAGVGLMEYEGETKVMGGPTAAVRAHCETYVIVAPGDVGKQDLAAFLAEEWSVSQEDVARGLPPGDVQVLEGVPARLAAFSE